MSSRIASTSSWMSASWLSRRLSSSVSLATICRFAARASRMRTKARTTKMLISMARWEFNTVAAMIAPCSVKA